MSKVIRFPNKDNDTIEYLEEVIEKLKTGEIKNFFCSYLSKDKEGNDGGDSVMFCDNSFTLMGSLVSSILDIYLDGSIRDLQEEEDE
jgi:hypothetical protein